MTLVNLAKFGLSSATFLTNAIRGICKKWLIDDYLISNKIDVITSMITSSGIVVANHLEKPIVIHLYQVSEVDQPDENDIEKISDETVHNWE